MLRTISSRLLRRMTPLYRHVLCAAVLAPVFALIHTAAFWLRFDGQIFGDAWVPLTATLGWCVAIKLLAFSWFQVFQGWNRYVTFHDLMTLITAATASSLLLLLADFLAGPGTSTPRSVFLMDWALTIVLVGGLRSAARFIEEAERASIFAPEKTPVFIVGANDTGEALLRAIRRSPRLPYRVVGFIADDRTRLAVPHRGSTGDRHAGRDVPRWPSPGMSRKCSSRRASSPANKCDG